MTEGWRTGSREVGGRGEFGGREEKGANRLGFGHCPENSATDLPLIKPPRSTHSITERGWSQPYAACRQKRPVGKVSWRSHDCKATASTELPLAIVLVISDSRCSQTQALLPTIAPWFNREGDLRLDVYVVVERRVNSGGSKKSCHCE